MKRINKTIPLFLLLSTLSMAQWVHLANQQPRWVKTTVNFKACGDKSYAFIKKQGIYSVNSKYAKLSDNEKHIICNSGKY